MFCLRLFTVLSVFLFVIFMTVALLIRLEQIIVNIDLKGGRCSVTV